MFLDFSNVVQNLKISRFSDYDPLIQNIKDPTLKAIFKSRKQPSIIAIESKYRYGSSFSLEADIEKLRYTNADLKIPLYVWFI